MMGRPVVGCEDAGRIVRRGFLLGMIGIGGSAATVFSYRSATRFVSSLKGAGRTAEELVRCLTLAKRVGAMLIVCVMCRQGSAAC